MIFLAMKVASQSFHFYRNTIFTNPIHPIYKTSDLSSTARKRLRLSIYVFAVFNRQDLDPDAGDTVENTIGPDSIGPHLVFLKSAFERITFGGMIGKVAERFFHAVANPGIQGLKIFDRLVGEPDVLH